MCLQVRQTCMRLVGSSNFPEADICKEIEQEIGSVHTLSTVSVSTQTDPLEQDTEEGGNKQYICTGTLTDDILIWHCHLSKIWTLAVRAVKSLR